MRSRLRRSIAIYLLVLPMLAMSAPSCSSHRPPNLSPAAARAWDATQVIKALDVVRDIAIAANESTPPLMTTDDTRKVVTYHQSAITTIHEVPNGWKPVVQTGLNQLLVALPTDTRNLLSPYVQLVVTLLKEVQ